MNHCDNCKYSYVSLADYPCIRCEYRKERDVEMEKIKCDFCKTEVEFKIEDSKTSGRASMITCPKCMRRIIVGFGNEKYYEEIEKIMLAIDNRVWYNHIKLRDGGKHYEYDK